jgi:protein farnesyltransferase/geranylgeranyltransferase type-1 subunit alpha
LKWFEKVSSVDDFSEKSLNLTTQAIRYNPFNYNFWIFRRKILRNLKYDPFRELYWCEELIVENANNFLSWDHRRNIANSNLGCCTSTQEFSLTKRVLESNAKNYHAWSHRQWALNTFKYTNMGLLSDEMRFTERAINEDIRNNSAWNQRFFIMSQRGRTDFPLVKKEFKFALEKIKIVNGNESAWNYARGLLQTFGSKRLWQFQELIDYCEHEYNEKNNRGQHVLAFLIDSKIETVLDLYESNELTQTQKIYDLCNAMATKHDTMRKNYWRQVYKQFYYDKIMRRNEKSDMNVGDGGGVVQDESWKRKFGKKHESDKIDPHMTANDEGSIDRNKAKKKANVKKKLRNVKEKPIHLGTNLLNELMDKYNNN